MIRQVKASDVVNRPALEGKIFAIRVVSFNPGDAIAFNDPNSDLLIFAAAPTYRRRRGWERIYLFPADATKAASLIIEATEDVEEELDPASGVQFDQVNGGLKIATGNVRLPSIVAAGSQSGAAGTDLNADDWTANQTRTSQWVDVTAYTAITMSANVQSLAGINGADTVVPAFEFSHDGHELPADVPLAATGAGGAGIYNGSPTASRTFVAAKFARIKVSKGALGGPHRMRVQWYGQIA